LLTVVQHSIADWYRRRGYVEYQRVDDAFWHAAKDGRLWPFMAVYLKKDVASAKQLAK